MADYQVGMWGANLNHDYGIFHKDDLGTLTGALGGGFHGREIIREMGSS